MGINAKRKRKRGPIYGYWETPINLNLKFQATCEGSRFDTPTLYSNGSFLSFFFLSLCSISSVQVFVLIACNNMWCYSIIGVCEMIFITFYEFFSPSLCSRNHVVWISFFSIVFMVIYFEFHPFPPIMLNITFDDLCGVLCKWFFFGLVF
jgi:hypothetical protein